MYNNRPLDSLITRLSASTDMVWQAIQYLTQPVVNDMAMALSPIGGAALAEARKTNDSSKLVDLSQEDIDIVLRELNAKE